MHRDRTITEPSKTGTHSYSHNGVPNQAPVTITTYSKESSISDEITPGWKDKLKQGLIVNNPMYMEVSEFRVEGSGTMSESQISNPSNTYFTSGNGSLTSWLSYWYGFGGFSGGSPVNSSRWIELVKTECLANIDPTPNSFAEDVGEIGETLRFLKNPVSSLLSLSKRIKKKRVRKLRQTGKKSSLVDRGLDTIDVLSDVWLLERFAAGPLIRSISQAMSAYETIVYRTWRQTARARRDGVLSKWRDTVHGTHGQVVDYEVGYDQTLDVHAGIIYEVTHPMNDWKYKYGLRHKDIPETVWNLVPLSFMLDRVIDISDSIRAITNLLDPNITIRTGFVVTKTTTETFRSAVRTYPNGYNCFISPDKEITKTFVMERSVWDPTFADVLPTVEVGQLVRDATNIADLLALSVKLIRG